jgi:hypothetical protein
MCVGRRRWRLDEVVLGLEGDSFFIASNAANFDALAPERDRSRASYGFKAAFGRLAGRRSRRRPKRVLRR